MLSSRCASRAYTSAFPVAATMASVTKSTLSFLCRLISGNRLAPTETDRFQLGTEWIPLSEVAGRNLFPRAIRDNLKSLTGYGETIFIGSEKEKGFV